MRDKLLRETLEEENIKLNEKKCVWSNLVVEVLGFTLSHKSVNTKESMVQSIKEWKAPSDKN